MQIFSFYIRLFILLSECFTEQKFFKIISIKSKLTIVSFLKLCYLCYIYNSSLNLLSCIFHVFLSGTVIVYNAIFRSIFYFELIFMKDLISMSKCPFYIKLIFLLCQRSVDTIGVALVLCLLVGSIKLCVYSFVYTMLFNYCCFFVSLEIRKYVFLT